jgi:integrase
MSPSSRSQDRAESQHPSPDGPETDLDEPGTELSPSTQRVYRGSWRDFVGWCRDRDVPVLPANPESVAEYLEERHHLALSTLRNRLSAISHYHEVSGLDNPTESLVVSDLWHKISEQKRSEEGRRSGAESLEMSFPPGEILREGPSLLPEHFGRLAEENDLLREKLGKAQDTWSDEFIERAYATPDRLTDEQRRLIPEVSYDLVALRDRALLLLMAAGGAGRAEVVRLDVTDVVPSGEGILVGIRKKNGMPKRTIQAEPEGDLRFCVARAVPAWILAAGLGEGPLFRSFDPHGNPKRTRISLSSVNYLLDERVEEAGFESDEWTPGRLSDEPIS